MRNGNTRMSCIQNTQTNREHDILDQQSGGIEKLNIRESEPLKMTRW